MEGYYLSFISVTQTLCVKATCAADGVSEHTFLSIDILTTVVNAVNLYQVQRRNVCQTDDGQNLVLAPKINDLTAGVVYIVVKCKKSSIAVVNTANPNYSIIDTQYNGYQWVRDYFETSPEVTCPVLDPTSMINGVLYLVD